MILPATFPAGTLRWIWQSGTPGRTNSIHTNSLCRCGLRLKAALLLVVQELVSFFAVFVFMLFLHMLLHSWACKSYIPYLRHFVTRGCLETNTCGYFWMFSSSIEAFLDLNEFKRKLHHLAVSTHLLQPWVWFVVLWCSLCPTLAGAVWVHWSRTKSSGYLDSPALGWDFRYFGIVRASGWDLAYV
jgi:hypothetical protein